MKAIPKWCKAVIALAALVAVNALLLFMFLSDFAPRKEEMRSLVQHKADMLRMAAIDARGRNVDKQHADTANLQAAFAQAELTNIDARDTNGSVAFRFDWTYLGDITKVLCYLPADFYTAPDAGEWSLTSASDGAWRWDGGGMMGEGYIIVERFQENWFYIEKYYPT